MKNLLFAALTVFVFSIASQAQARQFTVMTYNVENLFDWEHDQGKEDYTYLPKSVKNKSAEVQSYCRSLSNKNYRKSCFNLSWTPTVVKTKISNLAAMIRAAQADGPDIIVLQEVENIKVLAMLLEWEIGNLGYQTVELIEGPDKRGIDVAVISKFPRSQVSKLHLVKLPGKNPRPTRGILEVRLNVDGKDLAVFANHWPSPANPEKNRIAAAQTLQRATMNAGTPYVIAAGDFNTVTRNEATGLSHVTLNPQNPYHFRDTVSLTQVYADNPVQGTHWYRGRWDFLDKILIFNAALEGGAKIVPEYLRIVSPGFALQRTGSTNASQLKPKRFDAQKRSGFSDHLPLMMGASF